MRNEKGEVEGIFVEGYDVTHEMKAEQKIQALQTELVYVSRVSAMGTMAATLAHELNQPPTAIKNYTSAVAKALDASTFQEDLVRQGVAEIDRFMKTIMKTLVMFKRFRRSPAGRERPTHWVPKVARGLDSEISY